jgi:hypothetical protein
MSHAETQTFRVELTGTSESRAERERSVLRQVFGEDVDLNTVNVLGFTEPIYDIVDGRIAEVKSTSPPLEDIE